MKRLALASAVALAGCGEDAPILVLAEMCQTAVKAVIPTPATYQMVEAQESIKGLKSRVLFDAQNRFGALIRSVAICEFDRKFGLLTISINGKDVAVPSYMK